MRKGQPARIEGGEKSFRIRTTDGRTLTLTREDVEGLDEVRRRQVLERTTPKGDAQLPPIDFSKLTPGRWANIPGSGGVASLPPIVPDSGLHMDESAATPSKASSALGMYRGGQIGRRPMAADVGEALGEAALMALPGTYGGAIAGSVAGGLGRTALQKGLLGLLGGVGGSMAADAGTRRIATDIDPAGMKKSEARQAALRKSNPGAAIAMQSLPGMALGGRPTGNALDLLTGAATGAGVDLASRLAGGEKLGQIDPQSVAASAILGALPGAPRGAERAVAAVRSSGPLARAAIEAPAYMLVGAGAPGGVPPKGARQRQAYWHNYAVNVPDETFAQLGIKKAVVRANVNALLQKHSDQFASEEDLGAHLQYVLESPTHVLPASKPEYALLVRQNGGDKAAVIEVEMTQGRYHVKSAYTMEPGQLQVKLKRLESQPVGRLSTGPASVRYGSAAPSGFSAQGAVVPLDTSSAGNSIIPNQPIQPKRIPGTDIATFPDDAASIPNRTPVDLLASVEGAPEQSLRMTVAQQDDLAKRLGVQIAGDPGDRRTFADLTAAALANREPISRRIDDMLRTGNLDTAPEVRYVAAVRQAEAEERLATTTGPERDALLAEIGAMGRLMRRGAGEAARSLAFQRALAPEPWAVADVLSRAEDLTDGKLSVSARQSLAAMAQEAGVARDAVDAKIEAKAQDVEAKIAAGELDLAAAKAQLEAAKKKLKGLRRAVTVTSKRTAKTDAEVATRQQAQAERLRQAADQRMGNLAAPPAARPKRENPFVDVALAEYAKGSRDLQAWARGVQQRLGTKLDQEFLDDLFTEAAGLYRAEHLPVDQVRKRMARKIEAEIERTRPWFHKMLSQPRKYGDFVQSMASSFDFSGLLRQGGNVALAHPVMAARAARDMFQAARSESNAKFIEGQILARQSTIHGDPDHYDKVGLEITRLSEDELEEQFRKSGLAERIPGVQGSERAYATVLNRMRADLYDDMAKGLPKDDLESRKAVAGYVNIVTAKGDFSPEMKRRLATHAEIVWSPRMYLSQYQMMMPGSTAAYRSGISKEARQKIVGEWAVTTAARAALMVATGSALASTGAGEIELNPRKTSIGIARINLPSGKTIEIDMLGTMRTEARLLARLLNGGVADDNPITGEAGSQMEYSFFKNIWDFGVGKARPPLKMLANVMDGEDTQGRPFGPAEFALSHTPIGAQELVRALQMQGIDAPDAVAIVGAIGGNAFGAGTSVKDRWMEEFDRQLDRRMNQAQGRMRSRMGLPPEDNSPLGRLGRFTGIGQ